MRGLKVTRFCSIKISDSYTYAFEPKTEIYNTANCVYHFQCDCDSDYIGQTKRKLKIRIGEHFDQASKRDKPRGIEGDRNVIWMKNDNESISSHIKYCKAYKSKYKFFKKPSDPNVTVEQLRLEQKRINLTNSELKLEYFKTHFIIIQKNFRSKQHRMDAEAFFIKMKRPKLNKQEELSFFQLF